MALNEGECQQCRLELDKLQSQYERTGGMPEAAKARMGELEASYERECSGSGSSDVGAAVAGLGILGLGVLGFGLLAAAIGSRQ